MLRGDPAYAEKARRVSELAKDITEYLASIDLPEPAVRPNLTVAYHSACSMQHGQKITAVPKDLLKAAGFAVKDPAEGHLCCGSAGTYNIMQPEISATLKARKVRNIEATKPDLIATGNIGCITQIASGTDIPILHTVELLDWAYGGPKPGQHSRGEAVAARHAAGGGIGTRNLTGPEFFTPGLAASALLPLNDGRYLASAKGTDHAAAHTRKRRTFRSARSGSAA